MARLVARRTGARRAGRRTSRTRPAPPPRETVPASVRCSATCARRRAGCRRTHRAGSRHVPAECDPELPLECVPDLVLVLVDVQRRPFARFNDVLPRGERPAALRSSELERERWARRGLHGLAVARRQVDELPPLASPRAGLCFLQRPLLLLANDSLLRNEAYERVSRLSSAKLRLLPLTRCRVQDASCVRLASPSLPRLRRTWLSTVRTERRRAAAISLFDMPSATGGRRRARASLSRRSACAERLRPPNASEIASAMSRRLASDQIRAASSPSAASARARTPSACCRKKGGMRRRHARGRRTQQLRSAEPSPDLPGTTCSLVRSVRQGAAGPAVRTQMVHGLPVAVRGDLSARSSRFREQAEVKVALALAPAVSSRFVECEVLRRPGLAPGPGAPRSSSTRVRRSHAPRRYRCRARGEVLGSPRAAREPARPHPRASPSDPQRTMTRLRAAGSPNATLSSRTRFSSWRAPSASPKRSESTPAVNCTTARSRPGDAQRSSTSRARRTPSACPSIRNRSFVRERKTSAARGSDARAQSRPARTFS